MRISDWSSDVCSSDLIIGQDIEIGSISDTETICREPQPCRMDRAVRLIGYSDLEIADRETVRQLCARDRRRIAAPPLERIGEPLFERRQRIGARQPEHRPAEDRKSVG